MFDGKNEVEKGIMILAKLLDGVERRDGYRDKVHGIPHQPVKFSNVWDHFEGMK